MKATGIVRRIDDLGRIVIPKEIRRTLRIRETDPLEIFTDKEGEIILKNIHPSENWGLLQKSMRSRLHRQQGIPSAFRTATRLLRQQVRIKGYDKKNITKKWSSF